MSPEEDAAVERFTRELIVVTAVLKTGDADLVLPIGQVQALLRQIDRARAGQKDRAHAN